MARTGGTDGTDGTGGIGGIDVPGGEPGPAELWIGDGIGDGAPGGPTDPGNGPPGGRPGRRGGPGGPGRRRWIALAAGFAVLVAVVAVQHYASGTRGAAPDAGGSSSVGAPAPTSAPTARATGACSGAICSDGGAPSAIPATTPPGTPIGSMIASLSANGMQVVDSPSIEPSANATPAGPSTTKVPTGHLPAAETWTLLGYGPAGLVRYRPAAGQVVVTPVPPVQSDNVLSFLATRSGAIIRSMDNVEGYLVPDGRPAAPLTGLLAEATRVLPGPDPDHVWLTASTSPANPDDARTSLILVDSKGKPAGQTMDVPQGLGAAGGYAVAPDGVGYALVSGTGGVYDLTPRGIHLVTHGDVLAVGPTGYLVSDCTATAHCSVGLIDRATGKRRTVPGLVPSRTLLGMQGAISPDGSHAALWAYRSTGTTAELVDLASGHSVTTGAAGGGGDPSSSLLFTPDSRYLLVAGMTAVFPVDTRTGKALAPLPIPPVRVIALRPAG